MLSKEERWKLVEKHRWVATGLVNQFCRRHPSFWSYQDDLIQRVKLTMYGSTETFDPSKGGKFEQWCFRRARGTLIDFLRHFLRTQGKDERCVADNFLQTADRTAFRITSEDTVNDIWRLMRNDLPDEEYRLLRARYANEVPVKSLAALHGVSVPVIKGHIYRARVHAMKILESAGYSRPLGVAI